MGHSLLAVGILLCYSLDLASSSRPCKGQPIFVAQELSPEEKSKYNYYYTANNTASLLCCARFCAQTTFCRTAVYDYHAKTCGIVYASGVRCHNGPRQQDGRSPVRDIPLTAIHCPVCTGFGKDLEQECSREPKATNAPKRGITIMGPKTTVENIRNSTESTSVETEATSSSPITTIASTIDTVTPVVQNITEESTTEQGEIETTSEVRETSETEAGTTASTPAAPTTTKPSGADFALEKLLGAGRTGLGDCFPEYSQRALIALNPQSVAATFIVEKGLSLEECKCACASSWHSRRYSKTCRSIQYFPERRECFINNVDHTSSGTHQLTQLQSDTGSYYNFPCYRTELETTQYMLQNCRGLLPAPSDNDGDVTFSSRGINSNPYFLNDPAFLVNPCFETVPGYTLAAQAVEIRRGLSMQECMCVCAESRDFRCRSSLFKERTRECTLNLDNRVNLPHLFNKLPSDSGDRILYLGYTCNAENGTKYLNSYCRKSPPQVKTEVEAASNDAAETGLEISRGPGKNSDRCFVEIPQYSLQGKATAVKYGQSLEACKCNCLFSREIFDFDCRSIQYYFDSKSCILNAHDRLESAARFVRIRGYVQHSYFDFNCTLTSSPYNRYDWRHEFLAQVYGEDQCKDLNDFNYRSVLTRRYAKKERRNSWILIGQKRKSSSQGVPNAGAEANKVGGKDVFQLEKYGSNRTPEGEGPFRTRVLVSPGPRAPKGQLKISSTFPETGTRRTNLGTITLVDGSKYDSNDRISIPFNEGSRRSSGEIDGKNAEVSGEKRGEYRIRSTDSGVNPSGNSKISVPISKPGRRRLSVEVDRAPSPGTGPETDKTAIRSKTISMVTKVTTATEDPVSTSGIPPGREIDTTGKPNTTTVKPTDPTTKLTSTTSDPATSTTRKPTTTQKLATSKPSTTTKKPATETPATLPPTTTPKGSVPLSKGDIKGVEKCSYSTFYQMEFRGSKLLDRVIVTDAISCVHKCAVTAKCQSANFKKFTELYRYCEIFADIPLQYDFHDLQVNYNMESAHFAGITCEKPESETEES